MAKRCCIAPAIPFVYTTDHKVGVLLCMSRIALGLWLCLAVVACTLCSCSKRSSSEEELRALAEKGRSELLRDYKSHPDQYRGDDLWLIGRCYFDERRFEDAKKLFSEYSIYAPTDSRAWMALGNACFALKQWNEAISHFKKADSLGKQDAIRMLAGCYIASGDYQSVRELAPRLASYAETQPSGSEERQEVAGMVIAAATNIRPPDKALFDRFVKYLPTDASTWREDVREYVLQGFKKFGTPERFQKSIRHE
jgi:tetratricopeptide (TPR) repeat protein